MDQLTLHQRLRPRHATVFASPKRFVFVVAGRRWGKTFLALWWLVVDGFSGQNRLCYYIAPNYRQAKRIAWALLKQLIPVQARSRTSEEELSIELPNGSVIQLHGADHPDSLRGVGLNCVVLDEFALMDPDTWPMVVRPMLTDRKGRALFIGTPTSHNHFYDQYMRAKTRPDCAAFHFRTDEGGYVSSEELAAVRSEMDQRCYRQEFEGSFETLQGRVYHSFDLDANVTDIPVLPEASLLVGMDFNVTPMTAVVAQRAGDECQVIDEIVLVNSNTKEMMQELNRRYPGRHGVVHPDPSGAARKTSAPVGQTDFTIIEEAGWPVYKTAFYPLIDRLNTVNVLLCNGQGRRRLLVRPSCTNLIKALEGLTYKENTKIVDRASGFDHITDALGYLVMGVFPITGPTISESTVLM